jgi:DNA sulfur modification protein DndB
MATIIPALKGRLGNTTFYETTMKVADLILTVRPANDLDEWEGFSIEERMQRDPDLKRIQNDLAPYIAKSPDRFFGSIIVLVYKGKLDWESMLDFAKGIPGAYKSGLSRMGFITIDGVTLIILDGQHRWRALNAVYRGDVTGEAAANIADDDVCVIFIEHESDIKTRRIFNVVNRYAKQTSRGDNIITSEDDGYAIVARSLLHDDEVFGRRTVGVEKKEFIEWKRTTLVKRSLAFSTIGVIYESVKLILAQHGHDALDERTRPEDDALATYGGLVKTFWETLMARVAPYKQAADDITLMPDFRKDEEATSLLFKPAGQIALIDGMFRAIKEGGLTLEQAADRVYGAIDWSMTNPMWEDIIIKSGGTIDAGTDARRRTSALIAYLLASDKMSDNYKLNIWRQFNDARGKGRIAAWRENGFKDVGDPTALPEDLPKPFSGEAFTVEDARKLMEAPEADAA